MAVPSASFDLLPEAGKLPINVAVGWSGGADSTALLLALAGKGYRVHAWHVDHAWRSSSSDEAQWLTRQAAGWGIPVLTTRLPAPAGHNREASAREARYQCFERWAQQTGIDTLCLGHHRNDQAETVCMRLLQGAGISGCRGMLDNRRQGSLNIVRPLLHTPGSKLRQWLTETGTGWIEDASNHDLSIRRNHIRHRLFPAIMATGIDPAELFLRWQQQAARLTEMLERDVEPLLPDTSAWRHDEQGAFISWRLWSAASPPVRARLLQKMMAFVLGEGATPGRRHILLVEEWTQKSGLGGLDLSRCRLQRRRKHLHLCRTTAGLHS
ncbi:tRNA lysidine(34) synthetase TilS [Mariprofundus erugo]|uniref:tRNA(Ile)-lysidine synthase n=1 Tax=Mariprofundus erugo TaxID=2528639 RepID=A0A5R9GUP2_9PROT|nr:tRNA lysidine(34) synthetase TilS [Mariprofundus erugo]